MEKALEIPKITNTTLQYFVDGEYVDNVDVNEMSKMRENVLLHIIETKDASILNRFYFIGHEDTKSGKMGKEIKITMDSLGNFSDIPWEMSHFRRRMRNYLKILNEHSELFNSFINK